MYIKVSAAREFSFDHNRLADEGHFWVGSIRRLRRFHEVSLLGKLLGKI
jgi:hypothetical protein